MTQLQNFRGKMQVQRGGSSYQCKETSSIKIFREFIKTQPDGTCDATGIIGKACYNKWIRSRREPPKTPHEAFRRAVTAHIRGNDGRRPFEEAAEASLLKELRKKKQWDAFAGTDCLVGVKGFSSLGHHEKQKGMLPHKKKHERPTIVKTKVSQKRYKQDANTESVRSNVNSDLGSTIGADFFESSYNQKLLECPHGNCNVLHFPVKLQKTLPRPLPRCTENMPCDMICCTCRKHDGEPFDDELAMFFQESEPITDGSLTTIEELDRFLFGWF